jgi:hypothetical protein
MGWMHSAESFSGELTSVETSCCHSLRREGLQRKIESHSPCAERPIKPLASHRNIADHRLALVDSLDEPIRPRGDDRERIKLDSAIAV